LTLRPQAWKYYSIFIIKNQDTSLLYQKNRLSPIFHNQYFL